MKHIPFIRYCACKDCMMIRDEELAVAGLHRPLFGEIEVNREIEEEM